MNPPLFEEMIFAWKRKIAQLVLEHTIYEKMILNFEQNPVGFTSAIAATYTYDRSESVPITNVDDKRQILAIFCVSLSGEFLPIQLICHPRVNFFNHFIPFTQATIGQSKKLD